MFKTARIKFLSRFLLCKRCNSTWSYPFKTRSYKITHTPWLFKRFETISSFTLYQMARLFARYDMQKQFIHVWSKYLPMFYRTSQLNVEMLWLEKIDTTYIIFFKWFERRRIKPCIWFLHCRVRKFIDRHISSINSVSIVWCNSR